MEIYVLDKEFNTITCIDDYVSLIWTERYSKCGDFELKMSYDSNTMQSIKIDNYISIPKSNKLMIIENIETAYSSEEHTINIKGRSLEIVLDRRVIHHGWIVKDDVQKSINNFMIMYFLNPDIPNRVVKNMRFISNPRIPIYSTDYNMGGETLYSAFTTMLSDNNLGLSVLYNFEQNTIDVSIFNGVDRSYDQTENEPIVFSTDRENLIEFNYYESAENYANVIYSFGNENWGNRGMEIVDVAGEAGIYRREAALSTEINAESTGGDYRPLLKKAGQAEIKNRNVEEMFDGVIDSTLYYTYGEDYYIGDIVQLTDNKGHDSKVRISEFIISSDENGLNMYPSFEKVKE